MAIKKTAQSKEKSNKEKIKYLKRFTILDKEINRKIEEIAYWRRKLEKITVTYSDEPKRGGGSIYSRAEDIIAKIVDLEQEINTDIDKLIDIRQEILSIIEAVEDDRERLLLQYRYLDGKTFEWIAAEMNYSWRQIHRLHSKALTNLKMS